MKIISINRLKSIFILKFRIKNAILKNLNECGDNASIVFSTNRPWKI